ncbi:DNA polymerase epsilon subunit B2 [Wolffia australiana]
MGAGGMRKKVLRRFKIRGYTLKAEAVEEALRFLGRFVDAEDEALELLLDEIDNESLKETILDQASVQRVVNLLLDAESVVAADAEVSNRTALRVIDAFDIPKFRYDPIKKVFYEHTENLPIHGEAKSKATLYRDRFHILLHRISRDKHFSRPVFDSGMGGSDGSEITSIQSLIGSVGKKWIMGVISQLEDGHFFLEDLTAAVPVDLSNSKITSGFFVENTIIVAEGELLLNGIFQVSTCGFPPLEDRETSLSLLMGLDFFGGGILTAEETLRLSQLEKKAVNDMFVVLSDVWLDLDETVEKLGRVFDGYENEDVVPSLFVFMGSFCSKPCNLAFNSFSSLRLKFAKLGELIGSHPRIREHSRFLFIPGPNDAGPSTVLPRCSLPRYFTEELQNRVPNATFSSNPCRIKFYTQEIVFFRNDLLYRMQRSSLIPPSTEETNDPFEHLVATITHQSHLCPLPLAVQPIIWNYDHCLRLYPNPHAIVLGDKSEQKSFKYSGITCFNPGPFSVDGTFAAYRPCTGEVELSALDG